MSKLKSQILVIEDEPHQIELLRYNLEAADYEVLVAEDGEEGMFKSNRM